MENTERKGRKSNEWKISERKRRNRKERKQGETRKILLSSHVIGRKEGTEKTTPHTIPREFIPEHVGAGANQSNSE